MSGSLITNVPYGYTGYLTNSLGKFVGLYSIATPIPVNNAPLVQTLNLRQPLYGVFIIGIQIASSSTSTSTTTSSSSIQGDLLVFNWSDGGLTTTVPYPGTISGSPMIAPTGQIITGVTITSVNSPLIPTITATYSTTPSIIPIISNSSTQGFNGYMIANSDSSFAGLAIDGQAAPKIQAPTTFVPFKVNGGTNIWLTGIKISRPSLSSCSGNGCSIKLVADDGQGNNQRIFYLNASAELAAINSNPSITFEEYAPSGKIINVIYFISSLDFTPSSNIPPDLMPQYIIYANAPGIAQSSSSSSSSSYSNNNTNLTGLWITLGIGIPVIIGIILFLRARKKANQRKIAEKTLLNPATIPSPPSLNADAPPGAQTLTNLTPGMVSQSYTPYTPYTPYVPFNNANINYS